MLLLHTTISKFAQIFSQVAFKFKVKFEAVQPT